jgi:hypothetical protein
MEPRQPEGETMNSPEEMSRITERMRAFCDANQITYIVGASHGPLGSSIHIRMEDFARVFAGSPVDVTTGSGFDHLRGSGDGFDVLALRPMPMVLGPRVEVLS